ncbi:hypothetical protein C8P68_102755 [Mucilaginibacter yixingensis]|uniref:Uncharacterized protein n=1 Tax=Mucilaginibacter yixingensis TaxID=1295612 RepID=A0A2T5JE43_9SPHI|nr:hypothetical protein [Mucilaginibacter yixingensis]PTQ99925.1 hypothetical protein C8P68_102755 [Mucilaginibacter yixingensis]
MKNHKKEEENYDSLFYIIGLLAGMFTGAVIEKGFTWVVVGGVMGLLTAAFFLNVLVKGSEKA